MICRDARRNGHVDRQAFDLEDTEGSSDQLNREMVPKQRVKSVQGEARDFDIPILWAPIEQEVPDRSPDQPGSAAGPADPVVDDTERAGRRGILKKKGDDH